MLRVSSEITRCVPGELTHAVSMTSDVELPFISAC